MASRNEKGFARLFIIAVLLLMGVIVIGFFAISSSNKPNKTGFGNSYGSLTPVEAGKKVTVPWVNMSPQKLDLKISQAGIKTKMFLSILVYMT